MDQKTWLQMKRSLEKSVKADNSIKGNEEEKLPYEIESAFEETIKNLHEQVACLLCECNVKDKLIVEHAKAAQEANIAREKAESEMTKWKLEHDRRLNLEKEHKRLESKYTEARKKLVNLTVENARLSKALFKKEEIIANVSNQMSEATAEFKSLISRLNFTERGNDVLKHEYRVLEKELKMRNRHADVVSVTRKQRKKNDDVAKIEAERQRLRLLVRKRIPGPTKENRRTSVKINRLSEVEAENKILKENAFNKENEICVLRAEIDRMKCDESINKLEEKLLESENRIMDLKSEIERLKELKRRTDDQFENAKLINVDLDQQLSAAKLEIKEALRSVSFLEMELEERNHRFQGLEATYLELQLQLASKDVVSEDVDREKNLLQTGLEMTNNKKSCERSSLRDHMEADVINSPTIREIINTKEVKKSTIQRLPCALTVVPRGRGTELLRKLLFGRKMRRGGNRKKKKKLLTFTTYHPTDLTRKTS